jgi:phosphotransacetylase
VDEEIAHPILLGEIDQISTLAAEEGVQLEGIELIDPARSPYLEQYSQAYRRRRQRKGITLQEARERVRRPIYFGCMMVAGRDADALVAGEQMY